MIRFRRDSSDGGEHGWTTGYQWQTAADSSASLGAVASLVHQSFSAAETAAAGAGGMRTLVLHAIAPGHAVLRLVYKPSWRSDDAASQEFLLNLHVQP
jgi:predicted secreted protein